MLGSELLVQIVSGPGDVLRVLWVDVIRCKSRFLGGEDPETRNRLLMELYNDKYLIQPSPGSHVTSSVTPTAFSAQQLEDEAGLLADCMFFFSNTPGSMAGT
mmetsp:Transcript_32715/g.82518  ORF Transcript_32715/g.82518 Transcript_32715/m.82518 type:complete len:102 (+) Transcript_32715:377-682(+)